MEFETVIKEMSEVVFKFIPETETVPNLDDNADMAKLGRGFVAWLLLQEFQPKPKALGGMLLGVTRAAYYMGLRRGQNGVAEDSKTAS